MTVSRGEICQYYEDVNDTAAECWQMVRDDVQSKLDLFREELFLMGVAGRKMGLWSEWGSLDDNDTEHKHTRIDINLRVLRWARTSSDFVAILQHTKLVHTSKTWEKTWAEYKKMDAKLRQEEEMMRKSSQGVDGLLPKVRSTRVLEKGKAEQDFLQGCATQVEKAIANNVQAHTVRYMESKLAYRILCDP